MSATIKFNLNNEIRRITVQKQPTFEELSEILNRLYGNKLAKQTFALRYLDSEGDAVTVSSTEELEEAFRNFADRPIARFAVIPNEKEEDDDDEEENAEEQLRSFFSALLGVPPRQAKPACPLFAQRPTPCARPQQPAQEEKVAHHAFCDHCNSRIFGLRFKCAQCPDFDLCEKCFPSKNEKHDASHLFVRIARPYPPQFRYVRPSCVPKQETAKTEETKTESFPIKVEVTIPEEKTEEVKTEETVAVTEPEPVKEAETIAEPVTEPEPVKEAETIAEPVKEPEAIVAEPVKEEKKSPFEAKLEQLQEMGFADREKNIRILVKRSGDLAKAVRDLLE